MNHLKDRNFNPDSIEGEYNVVELWSKIRPARLRAGALAGVFAGTMMQIFGMIYCAIVGRDLTTPMKITALPILGRDALAFNSVSGLIVGLIAFYALMSFLGTVYGHFTGNNHKGNLFGIGLTWGAYGWIFITCLFAPAFDAYYEADIPRGVMFFAWLVYGISLMSVKWFDKHGPAR